MRVNLSDNAKFIIKRLQQSDFDCYAVGGCVRDSLRGAVPHDWDFTTSAKPDEIEGVFADCKTVTVGKEYGTVGVVLDGTLYEITTYRVDGGYSDSRHPEKVHFAGRLCDDLSRRDFTVNAMAYNDKDGLIDPFGGREDLHYGVIRCVGEPKVRLKEDALRILRALRFASTLGFSIEAKTGEAISELCKNLSDISPERISSELLKLLCGSHEDFILRRYRSVFAVIIPELVSTFDFDQHSKHHNRDVYRHIVAAVHHIEPDPVLRVTMLLHDIAKPLSQTRDANGECHYKSHQKLGAAVSREILKRLCMPTAFINEVCTLIRYHDDRLKPDTAMLKRYLNMLGAETMRKLHKIQYADIMAQSSYMREEKLKTLYKVNDELERIIKSGECYNLKMLNINGSDLIHLGFSKGEEIGRALNVLLDKVIEGELENDKAKLTAYVKSAFDKE